MEEAEKSDTKKLFEDMQKALGEHPEPMIALAMLNGLKELSTEHPEIAERWLRRLWDQVDHSAIQNAIRCKECSKKMTIQGGVAYIALEAYFSNYGRWDKAIKMLTEQSNKAGIKVTEDHGSLLRGFGKRMAEIALNALRKKQ